MTTYTALIHKDVGSDYGVSFPDLPGCVTAGSTLDEAMAMAKEALALHIEGLLEEGEEIPAPTPADAIDRDDTVAVAAIDVPDNLRVERVNITVPALSLQRFDAFAARQGMTRSGLFVEAVHRWIQATASAQVSRTARDVYSAETRRELLDRLIERVPLPLLEELAQVELGRQKDEVESVLERLRETLKGEVAPQSEERVINLLDALRQSLENEQLHRGKVKRG